MKAKALTVTNMEQSLVGSPHGSKATSMNRSVALPMETHSASIDVALSPTLTCQISKGDDFAVCLSGSVTCKTIQLRATWPLEVMLIQNCNVHLALQCAKPRIFVELLLHISLPFPKDNSVLLPEHVSGCLKTQKCKRDLSCKCRMLSRSSIPRRAYFPMVSEVSI